MVSNRNAPFRVVAVDDEPPALLALKAALTTAPDFELVAACDDPRLAESVIRAAAPDVLFLDIQMPGLTGLEVARRLGADLPLLVFVTAYDQYAIEAFEAEAVDYLLKPIDATRFRTTLERVRRRLLDEETVAQLAPLRHVLARLERHGADHAVAPAPPPRLPLRLQGRTTFVDPAQIDRIDADNNDIRLTIGREQLQVRETLGSIERRLPAGLFVRVHRSCLVNLTRVRHVEPYFHGDFVLILADGSKITTGRSYRERVRAALGLD